MKHWNFDSRSLGQAGGDSRIRSSRANNHRTARSATHLPLTGITYESDCSRAPMPAELAVAIYSLIGSAKLNGLDPEADPVELADALDGFAGDRRSVDL